MLKHNIGNVRILVSHKGEKELNWGMNGRPSHHFFYEVYCDNKSTGKSFTMPFYDSIANYEAGRVLHDELMTCILACIRADSQYTEDRFPSWEDFAGEFGYDLDNKEQERGYKRSLKLAEKINSVFTREELESMPE